MTADPHQARYDALLNLYHQGELMACYSGCRALLDDAPEHFGALQLLGVIDSRRDEHQKALVWLDRAIAAQPDTPSVHNNRGNVLLQLDRPVEALASYEQALSLGLENPFALNCRGTALVTLGRLDEALASFGHALDVMPDMADALFNRGELLLEIGRQSEGADHILRARACGFDAERCDFTLAALGAAPALPAMPPDMVRRLFDEYAHRFDSHLTGTLDYQAPRLVGEAAAGLAQGRAALDIADLGCGTGLCGPHLAPLARHLAGVDLSPLMLDRARALGLYHSLDEAELTDWLARRPGQFDLAVAADVLNYFGDLDGVARAAASALRPGGHWLFTVEADTGLAGSYTLADTRRYRHHRSYLEDLLARHGLVVLSLRTERLRQDRGAPVDGYLVLAQRPMA